MEESNQELIEKYSNLPSKELLRELSFGTLSEEEYKIANNVARERFTTWKDVFDPNLNYSYLDLQKIIDSLKLDVKLRSQYEAIVRIKSQSQKAEAALVIKNLSRASNDLYQTIVGNDSNPNEKDYQMSIEYQGRNTMKVKISKSQIIKF